MKTITGFLLSKAAERPGDIAPCARIGGQDTMAGK